jgi:hypothetical protein
MLLPAMTHTAGALSWSHPVKSGAGDRKFRFNIRERVKFQGTLGCPAIADVILVRLELSGPMSLMLAQWVVAVT